MLINYGEEWQKAWDDHLESWKPIPVESDYNNMTYWAKPAKTNNGKAGYVRAEAFNTDTDGPIRTMEEQRNNPYPHSVEIMCRVNVNHASAYLFAPATVPSFTRDWDVKDLAEEEDLDTHKHKCNVTARYEKDADSDDSEDDALLEDVGRDHKFLYTVEMIIEKRHGDLETVIREVHEIEGVPRAGIYFADVYYTSDVFLKHAFRHEMKLEVFPQAWMKKEEK